jgi:hypothetical protein
MILRDPSHLTDHLDRLFQPILCDGRGLKTCGGVHSYGLSSRRNRTSFIILLLLLNSLSPVFGMAQAGAPCVSKSLVQHRSSLTYFFETRGVVGFGPAEPAGYSSSGTWRCPQASRIGSTMRQDSSASSSRMERVKSPRSKSSRSRP